MLFHWVLLIAGTPLFLFLIFILLYILIYQKDEEITVRDGDDDECLCLDDDDEQQNDIEETGSKPSTTEKIESNLKVGKIWLNILNFVYCNTHHLL